jgi:VCBS repeat-containing protein
MMGNPGANVLKGAGGNDSMHGDAGNDAYVLDRADGIDEVLDFDPSDGNHDEVRFGPGIAPNEVRVSRLENDIRLRVPGGGEAYLRNWFDPEYRIESIRFADGTVWDAAMIEFRSTLPDNRPPVLSQPMADRTVAEDSAFDLAVTAFSDPDAGDVLTYSAALADGSLLPGWLSFDAATASFSGTPGNDDVGTLDITVTATDPSAQSVSDTFRLEVLNSNDAPLAADDSGAALEDGPPVTLTAALLLANDLDIDAGDSLSIVGTSDSAAGAAVSLVNGDVVYDLGRSLQTLGAGATTTDTFTYTVADAAGAMASATVSMTVAGVNDAPQLAMPLSDRTGREGEALSFTLPAGAFDDPDFGDALAYAVDPLPAWLHFDSATGTFGGTPGFADSGTYDLHVVATDRAGASASGAFRLTIEEVCNDGEIHAGGKHDDVLVGCACDDVLLGFGGDDALFGEGGDDVLRGDKGKDFLAGGAGNDLLDGGHARDVLDGGSGTNLLIGGRGADALVARGVNDIIAWNRGDGPDEVTVSASGATNRLTLSFGGGIGERDVGFKRHGAALEVNASGDALTLENWYALTPGERPTLTVQIIGERVRRYEPGPLVNALQDGKHADGAWRGTGVIAADPATGDHLVIGGAPAYDYAVHGSGDSDVEGELAVLNSDMFGQPQHVSALPDEHCGRGHEPGAHHGRGHDEDDERRRDFVSFWIENRLAAAPRFDFEALLADKPGQVLDREEIARRWLVVARHAHALAEEHDEQRNAAPFGWPGTGQAIGFAPNSAGFGYEGSVGASAGPRHDLEPLRGLTDGFRKL